ncbi:hypothetical protein SAMN05518854_11469 [Variovorax sp. YR266]|nr:hypothetical protein SAMN05518854_11469 [Variovorax sp. YR266]
MSHGCREGRVRGVVAGAQHPLQDGPSLQCKRQSLGPLRRAQEVLRAMHDQRGRRGQCGAALKEREPAQPASVFQAVTLHAVARHQPLQRRVVERRCGLSRGHAFFPPDHSLAIRHCCCGVLSVKTSAITAVIGHCRRRASFHRRRHSGFPWRTACAKRSWMSQARARNTFLSSRPATASGWPSACAKASVAPQERPTTSHRAIRR